ncbi:MAG: hypothetical protein Q4D21_01225 [Phascolarctobacterium sp.]|nr:hypothetical protein [Phascolarctobacterium sp.]
MEAALASLEAAEPMVVTGRIFASLGFAIVVMYIAARLMGHERKVKWFKRREKYSFFNRRGVIGEDINFGYPRTIEGIIVFIIINVLVFGFAFWNVILRGY